MPGAASDGIIKIAVLVNAVSDDNSRQFIEGCVSEGRSMGFTVDTFISGGDSDKCRKTAAGIAGADYDGLVFAYGGVDFTYDILKPVADSGIQIVTFEALPYKDGKYLKGLVTTFRDDYNLARLSLETLISFHPDRKPVRVIRFGCDPGITFLDRRAWVFDEFKNRGLIEEIALITINSPDNPYDSAWDALAGILPRFPPGSVDALWVPWDVFAGGFAGALEAAGRSDIKLVSIGISNDGIHLMLRHSRIWLASAAIDLKLAGTVNMRILAAMLSGENPKEAFLFSPQLVKTPDLNYGININNISMTVPGWGDGQGLFDHYQWMHDLKAAEGKYLRIPPEAGPVTAPDAP